MISPRHLLLAPLALLAVGALVYQLRPAGPSLREVKPAPAPAARRAAAVPENPDDAAARALALPAEQRLMVAARVLMDVADRPELAAQLARRFCAEDPEHIREYGDALILVLAESGRFDIALRFAATGGAESLNWLDCTFSLLAAQDLEKAAFTALARPEGEGFSTVARIWAGQDPARLAGFAMERLEGTSRALALEEALPQWLDQDPVAVSAWLDRFEPAAELDAGVSALALLPALARPRPDVALGWAASIVDPELRSRTLTSIATQWAGVNPFAARQHVSSTGELTLADRLNLLALLDRPPRPPD